MSDTEPAAKHSQAGAANTWPMDCWYFAGLAHEFKAGNQARQMFLGEPVVIGRTATGELFALRDICPHRLVPLSAGRQLDTNGEPTLECPYHGWRFGTDGVCRLLPSLIEDDPTDPSQIRVRTYPVHEAHGVIFVYVAQDPRFDGMPATTAPDLNLPAGAPKQLRRSDVTSSFAAASADFANPDRPSLTPQDWTWHPLHMSRSTEPERVAKTDRGWLCDYGTLPAESRHQRRLFGQNFALQSRFESPGLRWDDLRTDTRRLLVLTTLVPATPSTCRLTQLVWAQGSFLLRLAASARNPGRLGDALEQT